MIILKDELSKEQVDIVCMEKAKESIKMSTCKKKQLGCVLLTNNRRVIHGSNGPPSLINECDPCPRLNSHSGTDLHLCKAVHAERYAILRCASLGIV